jgi:hypothetical protein
MNLLIPSTSSNIDFKKGMSSNQNVSMIDSSVQTIDNEEYFRQRRSVNNYIN